MKMVFLLVIALISSTINLLFCCVYSIDKIRITQRFVGY